MMVAVIAARRKIALFLCGFITASVYHTGFYQISFSKYESTTKITKSNAEVENTASGPHQTYSSDPTASPTTTPIAPTASSTTSPTNNSETVNAIKVPKRKKTHHHKPLLTIVTGFSSNHFMEGINMLQSLIDVKYSGPIYIYLLHAPSKPLSEAMKVNFTQLIKESPLQETIVEMEVEEYASYCFKPRIIQDFLTLVADEETSSSSIPQVLLWSDSSTRFRLNPATGAKRMVRDQVDFASRSGGMGMGENTHQKTFDYFNMTKADFVDRWELGACTFLVNLERAQGMKHILRPYINCGLRDCHTCMAPVGTSKAIYHGTEIYGPPSSEYIAHRQDQSVLSLLAFQCDNQKTCNIEIDEKYYLHCSNRRGEKAEALRFNY
eukprot:scaffold24661_cov132-Cylindrotheca_fusiformis.AAC.6